MKANKQTTQPGTTNIASIFDDRRKNESMQTLTASHTAQDRRKSQFNDGDSWYLKASIN